MNRKFKILASMGLVAVSLYLAAQMMGTVAQVPSGTWRASGNMAQPRAGASSALLSDGRILLTGGTGAHGPLAVVEVYGNGGSVSAAASMTFARAGHISVVLPDGRVLVAGGVGADARATDTSEIFDPVGNAWSSAGPLMVPRTGATAVLLSDGRVLVAGGENSGGVTNTFEIFDPASNGFSLGIGVLSSPRKSHAVALLSDGRVLIAGGTDGANALASSDIYDPSTGAVSAGPSMSSPRQGLSATTLLVGGVLVAGGNNGKKDLASIEIFDPASGTFSVAPGTLAIPRSGHLAFLLPNNNGVLIAGGISNGKAQASSDLYYPWAGTFNSSASLTSERAEAAGSPLNQDGLLLVGGGTDAKGAVLSSTELYGFATIKTDRSDYSPHDTVTITGSGWEPGETVNLVLHEVLTHHGDRKLKATADAAGNIFNNSFTCEPHDDGVRFYLTATGSASQAQMTFTDKIVTTTTVTSSLNPSSPGQDVTFTATVTKNTGGNGTPSRTVQFIIDGVNSGLPVTLAACGSQSACASVTVSNLTPGTHTVEADYSSDVNFLSSSGTLPGGQVVTKASTTTTVSSKPGSATVFGQTVTFTATLNSAIGAGTATGTVTFFDGATSLGSAPVTVGGSATLNVPNPPSTTPMAVGTHSITATYSGDTSFIGSTSAAISQVITRAPTTITLVSRPGNSTQFGVTVTFVATLSATGGANSTTGTVTFLDGATILGTAPVTSGGTATLNIPNPPSTTPLTVGTHAITVSYGGDASFAGSTSAAYSQTVTKAVTTTTVSSKPGNTTVYGQTVTFVATLASTGGASSATGTVTFLDGATTIGTAPVAVGGTATLNIPNTVTTAPLVLGTHSITATYGGDSNFIGSTSAAYSQVVNKTPTTLLVTSNFPTSQFGQTVTLVATVKATVGAGVATGTVTFLDGATTLGTMPVITGGTATLNIPNASHTAPLVLGAHSITTTYTGDSNFLASTSPAIAQTVIKATTTTVVSAIPNPSVLGQTVTFTATLNAIGGASAATGTVTFLDGAVTLGTSSVAVGGFATLNIPNAAHLAPLVVGTHSLTATYAGDSNFIGSTSAAYSQVVNKTPTTTKVVSTPAPSVLGQTVTFTATMNAATGAGTATGTVTFKDGATTLGTATVVAGGSATLNIPNTTNTTPLAVGTHSVTAVYSGDGNFATSTSPVYSQVVSKTPTTTTVVSTPSPSVVGQTVTFTATLNAATGAGTATGTITFKDGATTLGTSTVVAGGSATLNIPNATNTTPLAGGTHSITAVYSGDGNFGGSTSAVYSQVVNKTATTTTVVSTPSPSVVGQTVTFTATLNAPTGAGTATGSVTFKDGATTLGAATVVAGGSATLNVPNATNTTPLAVGTHSITAVYSGDANFAGSTSAVYSQVVNKTGTTTTVVSTPSPSVVGQTVTFTATLGASTGAGTATGTVTFKDGATTIGTSTVVAGGSATLNIPNATNTTPLAIGTHSITAVYSGDGNFGGSTSAVYSQVVNKTPTTTTVVSTPVPSLLGQTVTFAATLNAATGAGTATGTVTFKDGAATLGTVTVAAGGSATLNIPNATNTTPLTVGTHSITAVYSGDTNFAASTSPIYSQAVNKTGTTATVVSTPSPSVVGQTVTFTATLGAATGAGTATGTVTFKDGTATLGTATVVTGGSATLNIPNATNTTPLTGATHSITAVYSGDANFAGATSTVYSQVVNKTGTTTTVVSTPSPSVVGQTVTFSATLGAATGAGTATGTVTFKDGATTLGTSTVVAGGSATLNIPNATNTTPLTGGTHSITAVYSGDANFAGSTSPIYSQVVNKTGTTTTVVSTPSPSVVGQTVTFSATLGAATGAGTATGTVTFKDGATTLGTSTVVAGGSATLNIPNATNTTPLTGGTHSITAVYSGDANFGGSTSAVYSQVVNKTSTTATVASTPSPSVVGQTVTFSATLGAATGAGTATGTVTFKDGATTLGTAAVVAGGSATLNIPNATNTTPLTFGTHSITAVYSGDANFNGSTSPVYSQVVNKTATTTTVKATPSPSVVGQTVTFTATLGAPSGAGTATGTVTFKDGAATLGTATVVVGGSATLNIPNATNTTPLAAGTHSITAVYSGDGNFAGSTSPAITQTVN